MRYTPEMNKGDMCFCFGSNLAGRHGAGAAKEAQMFWGARYGQGFGPSGHSWAIPTKGWQLESLSVEHIGFYVRRFLEYARLNPGITFLLTPIGCGLAGNSPAQIALLFSDAPANVTLPDEFKQVLNR